MPEPPGYSFPAVAGTGTIALGLACAASASGGIRVLARSEASADRAADRLEELCEKHPTADVTRISIGTDHGHLAECDLVVEAIVEELEAKAELLGRLAETCPAADLATTTSSLGIAALARRAGASDRFYGLHVFNPVMRMDLIEVCFPEALAEGVADRARAFCEALGKTAIEVPDQAGFVVNRLLFPFLFDAVRLQQHTGMDADGVDACMAMGAGHPLGPLKVLDFVGADVAVAIGRSLHADTGEERHAPPEALVEMVAAGRLGRKSGEGFYSY